MDTLPHLKICSKLPVRKQGNRSVLQEGMEGADGDEVNDEGKACNGPKLYPFNKKEWVISAVEIHVLLKTEL